MNDRVVDRKEVMIEESEFIVSKTDHRGCLTYANRGFMAVSGYPEYELLGKQHSIVRHPDMPRGIFHLLWKTISSKQECFLYIKNLARNGDYYWVFANVTINGLTARGGQANGYFSVQRKPSRTGVETIIPIYQEMLRIEAKLNTQDAPEASLKWLMKTIEDRGDRYESFIHSLGC